MKYIGIVVAMDEEKDAIIKIMNNINTKIIFDLKFECGKLGNKDCILVKSGVGKVNAARTTQILIDNFDLEYIINVGVSGAINNSLNIGDVLIAKHAVQHDFDITAFGHNKGYITGVGEKFECNTRLINAFKNIIEKIYDLKFSYKLGVVASGDIFCTDEKMKNKINSKFNADVVDMECAAIAQVSNLCKLAFISIRCISDIPNGNNASSFDENLLFASSRCADILKNYCSSI